MKKFTLASTLIFAICLNTANAQTAELAAKEQVATLDNIISTLYATVSGSKTQERNWNQLKHLCHPDVKFIYFDGEPYEEGLTMYLSIDEYINLVGDYFSKHDFYEREIYRKEDTFGPITQVFSTYGSFHNKEDEEPFQRGINSIQLLNDGERWWVVNVYWTSESEKNPIPKEYLPKN